MFRERSRKKTATLLNVGKEEKPHWPGHTERRGLWNSEYPSDVVIKSSSDPAQVNTSRQDLGCHPGWRCEKEKKKGARKATRSFVKATAGGRGEILISVNSPIVKFRKRKLNRTEHCEKKGKKEKSSSAGVVRGEEV